MFWGFLHGLYLCVNHAWWALAARLGLDPEKAGRPRRMAACLLTFLAVAVGWVFFRAATFGGAGRILAGMAGRNGAGGCEIVNGGPGLRLVAGLLLLVWILPNTQQWMRRWRPGWEHGRRVRHWARDDEPLWRLRWAPTAGWAVATAALAAFAVVQMARASEFIYYQF